jgi:hypothetical protein
VYAAINLASAELARAGLPKQNFNLQDDYFYRSIDDVIGCLAPALASHGLCVLPRVIERHADNRTGLHQTILCHVTLKVAFDLVSVEDGSCHTVMSYGEALDEGDKATAKAMSSAYKSAMLQSFCIPVVGEDDPDRGKRIAAAPHGPMPVQGWEQWSQDIIDMIRLCESEEALSRVQNSNRGLLSSIQRERGELYATIGDAFSKRRSELVCAPAENDTPPLPVKPTGTGRRSRATSRSKEQEHA